MKYKNTQKAVVMITSKESVPPFGITRSFTEKEIEESPELRAALDKEYLVPFDGKLPEKPATNPVVAQWQQQAEGKHVKQEVNGKIVEYVVADAVGVDGVSTTPEDLVASIDGSQSVDTILAGVDANEYKTQQDALAKAEAESTFTNAADAREADLLKESQEAEFSDEDLLAEKEGDRGAMLDADKEIAKDIGQVLVKNQGGGSDLKGLDTVVQETMSKAVAEINEATKPDADDGEQVSGVTSNRVVEFLSKPLPAKKWEISKENDTAFLEEAKKHTGSENVRSLITQRLNELG